MLDQAFEFLKTYKLGDDRKPLEAIDNAIVSTRDDAAARKDLETRLAAALKTDASREAKDYVCRNLMVIGTAASVPALAELLSQADHSHMARFALERIDAPEAAAALRDALPKVNGKLKIGVASSLGARRDAASVPALAGLLTDKDEALACAAATALGNIATADAAKALADAKPSAAAVKQATTDANLMCAEATLAAGKKADAMAIYQALAKSEQPKHVKLAVTRGMLACAGKKD